MRNDKDLISDLETISQQEVGSKRLSNYIFNRIDAIDFSMVVGFFDQPIIKYDGCYLFSDGFDQIDFDKWKKALNGVPKDIEYNYNIISLQDLLKFDEENIGLIQKTAESMRRMFWSILSQKIDMPVSVEIIFDDMSYPSVTFFVLR